MPSAAEAAPECHREGEARNATIAPAARLTQSEPSPAVRMPFAFVKMTCCPWWTWLAKIERHQSRPAGPLKGNVTPP